MESFPHFLALQTALAGRYSLERELGRGGMGIVYLAHDVALDRQVALKLLPPELAAHDEVRARFLNEARTAARLSHPNIVPIHAVDEVEGFVFFVMAYIQGQTLGERVRSRGPLSASEARKILREVAWALAHAHLQGVIHRDVKPDNILLEEGTGRALVTDFGIALAGAEVEEGQASHVLGTAEFMSPEQATNAPIDARSDLYSLGVLGYYALTGQVPFDGASAAAVLGRHVSERAPPVAAKAPGTPATLASAVDRCLRKDPTLRFEHGGAVAEALAEETALERQLPVPLRVFLKRLRRSSQSIPALGVVFALFGLPALLATLADGYLTGAAIVLSIPAAIAGTYLGLLALEARKLLRAGHTLADARLALQEDVIRRNEEFRFEVGPRTTVVDTIAARLALAGFGVAALSLAGAWLLPGGEGLWSVFGFSLLGGALAGIFRAHRAQSRADVVGERWLRILGGRIGDGLFSFGGLGLGRHAPVAPGSHRPTEMAIGLAAERLFEDLPRESRRALAGLPQALRKLEADARVLRGQVRELNHVLAEIGDDPAAPGAEERARVLAQVRATRDEGEARLRRAVAALETIRVGLLRMHAGEGVLNRVTMELEAAQGLSEDMANLLEGHREVERLLVARRATSGASPRP